MFTFSSNGDWERFLKEGFARDGVVSVFLSDGLEKDIFNCVTSAMDGFDPLVEGRWHLLVPNCAHQGISFARDVANFKFNFGVNQKLMDQYGIDTPNMPQLAFLDMDNRNVAASVQLSSPADAASAMREIAEIINRHMAERDLFDKAGAIVEISQYAKGRSAKGWFLKGKAIYEMFRL